MAPTGISAINIGGQTIHSFFRLPPKMIENNDIKKYNGSIYKEIDSIIIDEISMVRADLFDAIDIFMRLNGREPNKPFGGIQIILFGDLYQLSPVVDKYMDEAFYSIYKSPYFFNAKVMNEFQFELIYLTKVYRQKDSNFIEFLDKVRLGNIDEVSLEFINSKVIDSKPNGDFITLTPTNAVANNINQEKLSKLPDELNIYKASLTGNFKLEFPADLELKLKKDAQVIFIKNDKNGRWVNGTLGKVVECEKAFVKVKLNEDSSIVSVYPVDWDKVKYKYDQKSKKINSEVIGKFTQLPIRLAWALTIHKSQSQTLDRIHIDLTTGVWEFGHTYVSLSRCRTLEGISLENKINIKDIKVDPRITEFLKNKLSFQEVKSNGKDT